VGRPSTYASILGTIQDRGYVWKKGSALVPSWTAFAVVTLLERHFANLVDYAFTARMEDDLDNIANGGEKRVPWLTRFYFGGVTSSGETTGLKAMVNDHLDEIDPREVNAIPIGKDDEGREIAVRVGKYGPYLSREGGDTAPVPEGIAPDELTVAKAEEMLSKPSGDRVLGADPATDLPVIVREGRYGPYVQLGDADGAAKTKPRTASLFKRMALETLSLDEALQLLTIPRVLGHDPADGQEISAQNGRYGPYVKKGTDSRSLEDEDRLLTVTLDEAVALLAVPKLRGGRAAAEPLKELGPDPVSGGAVTVREGRFGPYVTDGTTNASLRVGDAVETVTLERAAELLQARRDRGPATPRRAPARKAPSKKATAKPRSARPKS
jgi:DNA topoisomerase-1